MDNLQLRQRIVRSMIRVSERTANMRKPEKFEYRKHIFGAPPNFVEHPQKILVAVASST